MSFEKKNTFRQGAPGSQFMCAPYRIVTKGEFERARDNRDRGLLRRRGLVLSIGDLSTKEPLRLRFVKSPGETKRVGCERVRGSPSFHHLLDI